MNYSSFNFRDDENDDDDVVMEPSYAAVPSRSPSSVPASFSSGGKKQGDEQIPEESVLQFDRDTLKITGATTTSVELLCALSHLPIAADVGIGLISLIVCGILGKDILRGARNGLQAIRDFYAADDFSHLAQQEPVPPSGEADELAKKLGGKAVEMLDSRPLWMRALGVWPEHMPQPQDQSASSLPDDEHDFEQDQRRQSRVALPSPTFHGSQTATPELLYEMTAAPSPSGSSSQRTQTLSKKNLRATEDKILEWSPEMVILVNDLFIKGLFISGARGSGKSSVAARGMELMSAYPAVPQIAFDIKRDFVSLVHEGHFKNGVIMTSDRQLYAEEILARRLHVVVDLLSWETMEERAQVIASLSEQLLAVAMTFPEDRRFPFLVHLDEAQQFIPQTPAPNISKETWQWCLKAVSDLAFLGRSFGATLCLYTQRIAKIHKDTISQQGIRIFMNVTEKNDLACYMDYLFDEVVTRKDIMQFGVGDAAVILPNGVQVVTHFPDRVSKHGSHTPTIEKAEQLYGEAMQRSRRVPVVAADDDGVIEGLAAIPDQFERYYHRPFQGNSDPALAPYADVSPARFVPVSPVSPARNSVSPVSGDEAPKQRFDYSVSDAPQAASVLQNVRAFPVSRNAAETDVAQRKIEEKASQVGNETREALRRNFASKNPMPHRVMARLFGLSGENYPVYQEVCRQLGIIKSDEEHENAAL